MNGFGQSSPDGYFTPKGGDRMGADVNAKISPSEMLAKDETSVVKHAIRGMLPKTKLGAAILKNCYIYAGAEHDQEAQKPTVLNLNDLK